MKSTVSLYIGPQRRPITGQSEAFDIISKSKKTGEIFLMYPEGKNILGTALFIFNAFLIFLKHRPCNLYLTISRSRLGFFRDMILINFASIFGVVVTVHLHGADFKIFYQANRGIRWLIKGTYTKVCNAIVLCNAMAEQFEMFANIKIFSVNNTISLEGIDYFKTHSLKKSPREKTLRVLYLSNLIPSKGIQELCCAVQRFDNSDFQVHLDICGRDGFDAEIDAYVKNITNTSTNIRYHGPIYGEQKFKALLSSDVVALPSYYPTEAQPICLVEGLFSGSAIIYSKHNYLPDIFSESVGFCVSPRSVESIVAALELCLRAPDDLIKRKLAATIYASANFSNNDYNEKIKSVVTKQRF